MRTRQSLATAAETQRAVRPMTGAAYNWTKETQQDGRARLLAQVRLYTSVIKEIRTDLAPDDEQLDGALAMTDVPFNSSKYAAVAGLMDPFHGKGIGTSLSYTIRKLVRLLREVESELSE